jgi:hypothetical protein
MLVISILKFYWCSLVQLAHFVYYGREVHQGYILQIYYADRFSVIGCLICRIDRCWSLTSLNFKAEVVKWIGNTPMMSYMVECVHEEQYEILNKFQC